MISVISLMPSINQRFLKHKLLASKLLNLIWIMLVIVVAFHVYENALPLWNKINRIIYPYIFVGLLMGAVFSLPSVWILMDYFNKVTSKIPQSLATFLTFVPALGKYIPGKIWTAGSFILHAKSMANITPDKALIFQVYYQLLGIASTLVLILAGYLLGYESIYSFKFIVVSILILASFFAMVILVRNKIDISGYAVKPGKITGHLIAMTIQKILRGISLLVFIHAFTDINHNLLDVLYCFFVAMQIGVLAFFSPAGLGVTESVYIILLSPVYGMETAILIALLSRIWNTILDLLLALAGLVVKNYFIEEAETAT